MPHLIDIEFHGAPRPGRHLFAQVNNVLFPEPRKVVSVKHPDWGTVVDAYASDGCTEKELQELGETLLALYKARYNLEDIDGD